MSQKTSVASLRRSATGAASEAPQPSQTRAPARFSVRHAGRFWPRHSHPPRRARSMGRVAARASGARQSARAGLQFDSPVFPAEGSRLGRLRLGLALAAVAALALGVLGAAGAGTE